MAWTNPITWTPTYLPYTDLNLYIRDNSEFLKRNIALEEPVTLPIVDVGAGAMTITITQSFHEIEEDDSDEVHFIAFDADLTGTEDGRLLILRAADEETIILRNGVGNLSLGSDIVLGDTSKYVLLLCEGGTWHLLAVSRNTIVTSGTGTVADSTTTVKIAHGLGQPPTRVLLTLTSSLGAAGEIYVSDRDVTANEEFEVSVNIDPEVDVTFDWRAWVGEGL